MTDPNLIGEILVERQDTFTIGREQRRTFAGVEDDAVTANRGDRWRRLRRALHPAFTWEGIQRYGQPMAERTADHVQQWGPGDEFDLLTEMRHLTIRILGDTLLGVDLGDGVTDVQPLALPTPRNGPPGDSPDRLSTTYRRRSFHRRFVVCVHEGIGIP